MTIQHEVYHRVGPFIVFLRRSGVLSFTTPAWLPIFVGSCSAHWCVVCWPCYSFIWLSFLILTFPLNFIPVASLVNTVPFVPICLSRICYFALVLFFTSLCTSPKPCLSAFSTSCHFLLLCYTGCPWVVCLPWVTVVTMFLAWIHIYGWWCKARQESPLLYLSCVTTRLLLLLWQICETAICCMITSDQLPPFLVHCFKISLVFGCYHP